MMKVLSEYMSLLPEYFQKSGNELLNEFLKGFEEVLSTAHTRDIMTTSTTTTTTTTTTTYTPPDPIVEAQAIMPPWASFDAQMLAAHVMYNVDTYHYNKHIIEIQAAYESVDLFYLFYGYITLYFNIVPDVSGDPNLTTFTLINGALSITNFSADLHNLIDYFRGGHDGDPPPSPPPPPPPPDPVTVTTTVPITVPVTVTTTVPVITGFIPEEELINNTAAYFDPMRTPAQFLDWFASWFSLKLNPGLEYNDAEDITNKNNRCGQMIPFATPKETYNRKLIQSIFSINKKKGTRWGLVDSRYPDPNNLNFIGGYLDFFIENMVYTELAGITPAGTTLSLKNFFKYELHEFLNLCVIRDIYQSYESPAPPLTGIVKYSDYAAVGAPVSSTVTTVGGPVTYNFNSTGTPEYGEGLYVGKTTVVHEKEPYYFWIQITVDFTMGNNTPVIRNPSLEASLMQKVKTDLSQVIEYVKPAHTYYIVTYFDLNGNKI